MFQKLYGWISIKRLIIFKIESTFIVNEIDYFHWDCFCELLTIGFHRGQVTLKKSETSLGIKLI